MKQVIAFTGAIGSGKSFAAGHLVNRHEFKRVPFAGDLKRITVTFYRMIGVKGKDVQKRVYGSQEDKESPDYELENFLRNKTPSKTRDVVSAMSFTLDGDSRWVQSLTDWLNYQLPVNAPDVMTSRHVMQTLGAEWARNIDEYFWVNRWIGKASKFEKVVCDDLRFPNEAKAIRDCKGEIIKILGKKRKKVDKHVSESFTIKPHVVIRNTYDEVFKNLLDEHLMGME